MTEYVDWQKKLSDDFDVDGYMMPNESARDFHAKFRKAKDTDPRPHDDREMTHDGSQITESLCRRSHAVPTVLQMVIKRSQQIDGQESIHSQDEGQGEQLHGADRPAHPTGDPDGQ